MNLKKVAHEVRSKDAGGALQESGRFSEHLDDSGGTARTVAGIAKVAVASSPGVTLDYGITGANHDLDLSQWCQGRSWCNFCVILSGNYTNR